MSDDQLEQQIDLAFKAQFLTPKKPAIVAFLEKVLTGVPEFQLLEDHSKLKVIEVIYEPSAPPTFLLPEPCELFHEDDAPRDNPELTLEDYNYLDIEEMVQEVLTQNQIDFFDAGEFDSALYWENKNDLEMAFLVECWQEAKQHTGAQIFGFLMAGDSSNYPIDLDTGKELEKDGEELEIDEYLESLL